MNPTTDHASKIWLRKSFRAHLADWIREFGRDPDRVCFWGLVIAVSQYIVWVR